MATIRTPAVAGLFYPANPQCLLENIGCLLSSAQVSRCLPKVLIVPHAGYIYSGVVAASAYVTLKLIAECVRRVVLLGPAHRTFLHGLALPREAIFATPLGQVKVDATAAEKIARLPQVSINSSVHALEHSLEVQLPFLQYLLEDFSILPVVVGKASVGEVSGVLDCVWGGEETLIIISSDLSHYLPYAAAQREDNKTAASILELHQEIDHTHACGATPINALMAVARKHCLIPHLLDLRNSGDTAGSTDRVVGYGAFAFMSQDVAKRTGYAS
nr:AmmeMemoRadiSam system protein B [Nitrosomonas nitrosa]